MALQLFQTLDIINKWPPDTTTPPDPPDPGTSYFADKMKYAPPTLSLNAYIVEVYRGMPTKLTSTADEHQSKYPPNSSNTNRSKRAVYWAEVPNGTTEVFVRMRKGETLPLDKPLHIEMAGGGNFTNVHFCGIDMQIDRTDRSVAYWTDSEQTLRDGTTEYLILTLPTPIKAGGFVSNSSKAAIVFEGCNIQMDAVTTDAHKLYYGGTAKEYDLYILNSQFVQTGGATGPGQFHADIIHSSGKACREIVMDNCGFVSNQNVYTVLDAGTNLWGGQYNCTAVKGHNITDAAVRYNYPESGHGEKVDSPGGAGLRFDVQGGTSSVEVENWYTSKSSASLQINGNSNNVPLTGTLGSRDENTFAPAQYIGLNYVSPFQRSRELMAK